MSAADSIFLKLSISSDYVTNKALFDKYNPNDNDHEVNSSECLNRIIFILNLYQKWVNHQIQHQQENIANVDIYEIIDNKLSDNYNINSFLSDYRYITSHNRDCVNDIDEDLLECDIECCYIERRVNRNKSAVNENKRGELFFGCVVTKGNNNDDVALTKSIMIQDILDGLHEWIYHTIHVKLEQFIQNDHEESDDDDEAEDEDESKIVSLVDDGVKAFTEYIQNKVSSSTRYRSNRSTNSRYNKNNVVSSKFMTTTYNDNVIQQQQMSQINEKHTKEENNNNTEDAIAIYQSLIYGNNQLLIHKQQQKEKQKDATIAEEKKDDYDDDFDFQDSYSFCFIDYFFKEISTNAAMDDNMLSQFKQFFIAEAYDSDAIEYDIEDVKKSQLTSNILLTVSDNSVLLEILIRFCDKRASQGSLYDAGHRFFYWPYYKEIDAEYNILYQTIFSERRMVEGNPGYSIKQWYISCKYETLKDELLYNKICQFTIQQFTDVLNKSEIKLKSWLQDPQCRKLINRLPWWQKCYGIKPGEQISVSHVMSILFYTNFTKQSASFSGTFRRKSPFEADESLKARNREYWNWSKLMRETIECFGQTMSEGYDAGLRMLYHGVSSSLIFDSTFLNICGPLSTTAEFEVAHNVFGATGIVLSIMVVPSGNLFWDCNYWSCYQNENERAFLGGLGPIQFTTIRDIPLCVNYAPWIKVLTLYDSMIDGYKIQGIVPKSKDVRGLSAVIDCIINDNNDNEMKNESSSVPSYIITFFKHFLLQKEMVQINIHNWTYHKGPYDKSLELFDYGYSKFLSNFFISDDNETNKSSDKLNLTNSIPKFDMFINSMPNLKRILIFSCPTVMGKLKPSLSLSDGLYLALMNNISLVSSMSHSLFEYIQIVFPTNNIDSFINEYGDKFENKGWKLSRSNYKFTPRNFELKENSLMIERI